VADKNANGVNDPDETCINDQGFVVFGQGTRPRTPACVADQWGTVIDTIGYQITGGIGDWFESPLGLDAIGIDNEMWASHIIPNTAFEPGLEQTHIDGNKGLIFSQVAALLTSDEITFEPAGKVGYVHNPKRLQVSSEQRSKNPGMPAQNDIDTIVPCHSAPAGQNLEGACGDGAWDAGAFALEFDVKGPDEGIWNGGVTVEVTKPNASGISDGNFFQMHLQHQHEGQWQTISSDFNQSFLYAQAGAIITANDPTPGRYRVLLSATQPYPLRVKVDFNPVTAEGSPGQAEVDASSMDFFDELNRYVPAGKKLEALSAHDVSSNPQALGEYDSIVLVGSMGDRAFLTEQLGLAPGQANVYFDKLKRFVEDGGTLVLTDGALRAAAELGVVPASEVRALTSNSETNAGNYNFQIAGSNTTYTDPERYPLAAGVNKPGAAEQENGRRQAVEPTPLGYSPDYGMDPTPKLPFWGINRPAWEAACGLADCTTATTLQNGTIVNLGEAKLGAGRVRIAGALLPDPIFEPDPINDHRFGVADYSLTYTGWEVFRNLVR